MKEEIKRALEERGFTVVDYSGLKTSVDFIAKKGEETFVVRVLGSLEALKPDHARDMIVLARLLRGVPLVVTPRSRWGELKEGVLYYRYGVPAVAPSTFYSLLEGDLPTAVYTKGREVVQVDSEKLRKRREELGLSLQKLAELVDSTKETIYRYEHGHPAAAEIVERIEEVLGERIRKGIMPTPQEVEESLHYPFALLPRTGAEVGEFRRMPWQAIGRRKLVISFLVGDEARKIKRRIEEVRRARGRVIHYYLVVGKRRLRGVPFIDEEELAEVEDFAEIEKIARERNEER